jgi:Fe2+ transport system protein B
MEDFNKDLINQDKKSLSSGKDPGSPMLCHTKSDKFFNRKNIRHNINSVIEKDENLLDDLTRDRVSSNYSIGGDDIRTSNERSEVSETTKNINASYDEDNSNRREEIEASIESLELKASMLVQDDEQVLKLCQDKVKEYFEKCMENENTSDEEVKKYIHKLVKSKQTQSPAVGDLNSFEKINELITILSKIQYQLIELKNLSN